MIQIKSKFTTRNFRSKICKDPPHSTLLFPTPNTLFEINRLSDHVLTQYFEGVHFRKTRSFKQRSDMTRPITAMAITDCFSSFTSLPQRSYSSSPALLLRRERRGKINSGGATESTKKYHSIFTVISSEKNIPVCRTCAVYKNSSAFFGVRIYAYV